MPFRALIAASYSAQKSTKGHLLGNSFVAFKKNMGKETKNSEAKSENFAVSNKWEFAPFCTRSSRSWRGDKRNVKFAMFRLEIQVYKLSIRSRQKEDHLVVYVR